MNIGIIGGGFCGVSCARTLAKSLPEAHITLFNKDTHFEYHGDLYKVISGASPHLTRISYHHLLNNPDVQLKHEWVTSLNAEKKQIITDKGTYTFDYLVLSPGSKSVFYDIPGIEADSRICRSTTEAVKLHKDVIKHLEAHTKTELIIAGAGPAGIEFASYIAALFLHHHHPYSITLLDAAPQILPMLTDADRNLILQRLSELHVYVHPNTKIKEFKNNILSTDKGSMHTEFLLWSAGQKASTISSSTSALQISPRGSYQVNEYLQTSDPQIYAGGDASSNSDAGLAWSATAHGKYIARHLIATVKKSSITPYVPIKAPFVLPVGPNWAFVKHDERVFTGFEGNIHAKALKADLLAELLA